MEEEQDKSSGREVKASIDEGVQILFAKFELQQELFHQKIKRYGDTNNMFTRFDEDKIQIIMDGTNEIIMSSDITHVGHYILVGKEGEYSYHLTLPWGDGKEAEFIKKLRKELPETMQSILPADTQPQKRQTIIFDNNVPFKILFSYISDIFKFDYIQSSKVDDLEYIAFGLTNIVWATEPLPVTAVHSASQVE